MYILNHLDCKGFDVNFLPREEISMVSCNGYPRLKETKTIHDIKYSNNDS